VNVAVHKPSCWQKGDVDTGKKERKKEREKKRKIDAK
jgi:hypothetical protein